MFVPICKSFWTKTISYFLRNICLLFRPHGPSKGSKSRRPRINYLKHGLSTRRYCNFDNSFYLCTYLQFISPVIFHAKNVGKRNLASMMLRKCDLFSKQYFLRSETRFHGSLTRWEIAALEERLVREEEVREEEKRHFLMRSTGTKAHHHHRRHILESEKYSLKILGDFIENQKNTKYWGEPVSWAIL